MTADGVAEDGPTSPPVRVLICDDHAVFRRGLMLVLELDERVEVVGEAADGPSALTLAQELAPDVVLMDVRMPGMSGIETTRRMAALLPSTRIIVLTVSDEEDDLYEAIKAGASGYLLKEISMEEVGDAVESVMAGNSLITPSMASKLLTEFTALARQAASKTTSPPRLTDRELQVLRLIATGMSNREIAGELTISENTVKNHVRNILEKLHLHSRVEAVMYALRENIIDLT
jgi:two-component system NarL family response regulator